MGDSRSPQKQADMQTRLATLQGLLRGAPALPAQDVADWFRVSPARISQWLCAQGTTLTEQRLLARVAVVRANQGADTATLAHLCQCAPKTLQKVKRYSRYLEKRQTRTKEKRHD